jgi:hypothetical protein
MSASRLVTASLAIGWLAWELFFHFAERIWGPRFRVDPDTVTWWFSSFKEPADGVEPQVLAALAIVATVLLSALAHLLPRASRRVRVFVTLASSCGALLLCRRAHIEMPLTDHGTRKAHCAVVVFVAVVTGLLLGWGPPSRRSPVPASTALLLVPVAFLPAAWPSIGDAMGILSPALRLLHGAAPASVYMQYDYLPALATEAWLWLGGDPMAIFFAASLSYYALLVGLLVLARRWFSHPELCGPLLVTIVLIRIYAVMGDSISVPQIAPFRLDLWILPVAVALTLGVRHWAVAATVGLLCLSSQSVGVPYVCGYVLAFPADFLAARLSIGKPERPPLRQELRDFCRSAAPNAAIIIAWLALTTWWLGSPISIAALSFHKLGIGQTRIAHNSLYWLLLPLTALSGGLAFWKRGERGEKKGGAMLLTVALSIFGSFYFFGRSHENNLIALSVPFLLCLFLSFDILLDELERPESASVLPSWFRTAKGMLTLQVTLSSALIALCAFQYSGRVWLKAALQIAVLSRASESRLLFNPDPPQVFCEEVAQGVPNKNVYFFTALDTWSYQACNYAPPSYQQPITFSFLRPPLTDEIGELLDGGYTLVLTKGDTMSILFTKEFAENLSVHRTLVNTESAHYTFISRGADPKRPPRPRRRRPARGSL